jgi:2,4-dienoyl-CoA reductase-like NADH-dependent reductase (Old Yellow Enzyme family)/thioredoxin reductase
MATEDSVLFRPIKIGGIEIKNRFALTGLGTGLPGADGSVTDEYIAYMAERAKGGVGLLITEVVRPCDGHALTARYQLSAAHDFLIPGMRKLADAVHEYGSKIFFQLHHPGRETFDEILNGIAAVAPSAIPCPVNKATTRAIEIDEIRELVRQFGEAAARIKEAGVDGVEFHGAHGYLIHQFLSPWTNRRTDEYGGSFDNRFRFAGELIDEVRRTCGKDFPVSFRFSVEDFMGDKAIDLALGVKIAQRLEDAGVDLLDATMGFYETGISNMLETAPHFQGWRNLHLKELSKHLTHKIPLLAVNSARAFPFAEWMVEEGMTDIVGMGRTFLADPLWIKKVEQGIPKQIRPCLSCVYCVESLRGNAEENGELNTCAVNARAYNESKYPKLNKDGNGRTISVIGAGPAGMECALTLAERGFQVDIFEQRGRIGGQLNLASKPKDKYRIEALVAFYETVLIERGVRIHTDTAFAATSSLPPGTEAVFVSAGSLNIVPNSIPGTDLPFVYSAEDILTERVQPRNSLIAMIGSGLTGLEVTEYLASRSNVVYVFDMLDEIGKDIYFQHKEDIMAALEPYAVRYYPLHRLIAVSETGIAVKDLTSGGDRTFTVDGVVLSLGMRPNNALFAELKEKLTVPVVPLGDTVSVGRIKDAIHSGFKAAFAFV